MAADQRNLLAHIVNPVAADTSSDLHAAQPVTFETMRVARETASEVMSVDLLSAQFPEDHTVIPDHLLMTTDLKRSISDVATVSSRRKLPLISDILSRAAGATDAEFLIYSNVDIALMPRFYLAIKALLDSGPDALIINRRTIPSTPSDVAQLDLMWAHAGKPHPGLDCFVFRREAVAQFDLGSIVVGANFVGKALLANLIACADTHRVFRDLHLTFHLGDDRAWSRNEHSEYNEHNYAELGGILRRLQGKGLLDSKPELRSIASQHRSYEQPWRQALGRLRSTTRRLTGR